MGRSGDIWLHYKRQILEGNHMKCALTAHSMTYSAPSHLHFDAFLETEQGETGADHPNVHHAALATNVSCQEGQYSELGIHHKEMLSAMDTDGFKEKLQKFDQKLQPQRLMFKFANDYMKFVACLLNVSPCD